MIIHENAFGVLAICALRYCQGGATYMPELVRDIIRSHLVELSDKDLAVMINDCKSQEMANFYGNEDIDKPDWIKWRETLEREQEKRRETLGGKRRSSSNAQMATYK